MNDLLTPPADQQEFDPNKDYLQELTGPGGKFDRTKYPSEVDMYKAMAKGKYEADRLIETKNRVTDQLSEDYRKLSEQANTGPKLQELIDRLAQQQNSNETPPMNESQEKPVYDPKEIETLFEAKLQQHESAKKQQENFNTVQSKLKEKFGENYANILKQQVDSMPGITPAEVNDLAKKSPEAFFRLMGLNNQVDGNFQAPFQSTQRNFSPTVAVRNEEYYDNLRKTNKELYYNPKTQIQMHNDAQKLGRAYFKSQR